MSTLAEISATLKKSNATMESVNALLAQMLNEDKRAREDARKQSSQEALAAAEASRERRKQASAAPAGFGDGLRSGATGALNEAGLGFIGAWGNRVVAALFGGAALAAVTGTIGSLISRGAIFGGVAALVGAFGDDLVKNLFSSVAPNIDPDTADRISQSISSNASAGLLAAIIPGVGVKGGIGVTLGGILGDGINSYLGNEENQRVIMNVLGQEITSEDAVRTTMQAAGAAALLAGPMVGIVTALAGLAVVAGTRLQEWIETRRTAAIDAIEAELDARLQSGEFGETAGAATLGSTIANALGLNIQDEANKTVDALITDLNRQLTQTLRSQQAAAGMLDEFAGVEGGGQAFGTGAIDLAALDPQRRAEIEQAGATLDQAFIQSRSNMADWTAQSLRNFRVAAEALGRQEIVDYVDALLNRSRPRQAYEAPELSILDYEGLGIPSSNDILNKRTYEREQILQGAAVAPVVINNVNNSTAQGPVTISKGGDTYRSSTPAPYAVDTHYANQYLGVFGR